MYKSIDTIRQDYNDGAYHNNTPYRKKVPVGHIFDEELSVRANREMVEAHNQEVEAFNNNLRKIENDLFKKLTEDVIQYLMDTYDFPRKVAELVEGRAYSDKHSCMSDYFYYVDELADIVSDCIEAYAIAKQSA